MPPTALALGSDGSVLYVMEREVKLEGGSSPRVFDLAVGVDTSAVSKLRHSFAGQVVFALVSIGVVLFLVILVLTAVNMRFIRSSVEYEAQGRR